MRLRADGSAAEPRADLPRSGAALQSFGRIVSGAGRMAGGLTVAIGGLGALGAHLARALDAGVEGLSLVAVTARDRTKAERTVSGFRAKPAVVALHELAERAEVVVEAAPAAVFAEIAEAAVA